MGFTKGRPSPRKATVFCFSSRPDPPPAGRRRRVSSDGRLGGRPGRGEWPGAGSAGPRASAHMHACTRTHTADPATSRSPRHSTRLGCAEGLLPAPPTLSPGRTAGVCPNGAVSALSPRDPSRRPGRLSASPRPPAPSPPLSQALKSHDHSTKPVYVSVGHRISLEAAVRLTRRCCRFRIPEPVRQVGGPVPSTSSSGLSSGPLGHSTCGRVYLGRAGPCGEGPRMHTAGGPSRGPWLLHLLPGSLGDSADVTSGGRTSVANSRDLPLPHGLSPGCLWHPSPWGLGLPPGC